MSSPFHAIVWIDQNEAKLFCFNPKEVERLVIYPHDPEKHIFPRADSIGADGIHSDHDYFERVSAEIADATAVLITGPAEAKSALAAHIVGHYPELAIRIAGIETIDHSSDGALLAVARLYFKSGESLRPRI